MLKNLLLDQTVRKLNHNQNYLHGCPYCRCKSADNPTNINFHHKNNIHATIRKDLTNIKNGFNSQINRQTIYQNISSPIKSRLSRNGNQRITINYKSPPLIHVNKTVLHNNVSNINTSQTLKFIKTSNVNRTQHISHSLISKPPLEISLRFCKQQKKQKQYKQQQNVNKKAKNIYTDENTPPKAKFLMKKILNNKKLSLNKSQSEKSINGMIKLCDLHQVQSIQITKMKGSFVNIKGSLINKQKQSTKEDNNKFITPNGQFNISPYKSFVDSKIVNQCSFSESPVLNQSKVNDTPKKLFKKQISQLAPQTPQNYIKIQQNVKIEQNIKIEKNIKIQQNVKIQQNFKIEQNNLQKYCSSKTPKYSNQQLDKKYEIQSQIQKRKLNEPNDLNYTPSEKGLISNRIISQVSLISAQNEQNQQRKQNQQVYQKKLQINEQYLQILQHNFSQQPIQPYRNRQNSQSKQQTTESKNVSVQQLRLEQKQKQSLKRQYDDQMLQKSISAQLSIELNLNYDYYQISLQTNSLQHHSSINVTF